MNKSKKRTVTVSNKTFTDNEPGSWTPGKYSLIASLFIITAAYYYLFGNHVFFYQENLLLFIFSADFLRQFAVKPGGLLEYAGYFLNQFYFSNILGAIILATLFALISFVFFKINKRLSPSSKMSVPFAALAASMLILAQTNINFFIHNNLGLLFTGLFFLLSLYSDKKHIRVLILVLFPVFFYLTGAFAWIFLVMFLAYNLLKKQFIFPLFLLITAGFTLFLFKEILFFQPLINLFYYPLPVKQFFTNQLTIWLVFLFFAVYPALFKLIDSIKTERKYTRVFSVYSLPVIILITVILLVRFHRIELTGLFEIEKKFVSGDLEGVIEQQQKERSETMTAQYYYITALSESGNLCDRLFFAPQNFKSGAICIPWNSQIPISQLFRGVYFYYSIGLINEAHRWAFESLVIQGYRPENIKLLIKTELINGNYKIAAKYIHILKQTFNYRKLAEKYEKMLENPELIKADPELGEKIKLMPKANFIVRIRDPYMNISSLSEANPENRKAYEYEMAWLMMNKDLDGIAKLLGRLPSMNYTVIPRHIEEAVIFLRLNMGMLYPDLASVKISSETESRYASYITYLSNLERNKARGIHGIPADMRDTFWYYLNFK